MYTGSIIFAGISILAVVAFIFYIKNAYMEFNRKETIKDNIVEYRANIKSLIDYFRENYNHYIYNDVKLNVDFCTKIILNKSLEEQCLGFRKLYETLYEVGYRLKTRYDDVNYILTPLKNLRARIFQEHIDFIKENSEGQEGL